MKIIKTKSIAEMSRVAADIIAAAIREKPDGVLGFATGSSPIGIYDCLTQQYNNGELDFSRLNTVNLDEYVGLDPQNDQSYRYFMQQHLFSRVNIDPARTHVPSGISNDTDAECLQYEALIEELGGIDLQLLGIGHDGHIGFNEPAESFPPVTHKVALTEMTINANKRFFASEEDVPRYAVTMGIGTIMKADRILMVAYGADKADILRRAFFGPVVPEVPASILQLHRDFILIADEAALTGIPDEKCETPD